MIRALSDDDYIVHPGPDKGIKAKNGGMSGQADANMISSQRIWDSINLKVFVPIHLRLRVCVCGWMGVVGWWVAWGEWESVFLRMRVRAILLLLIVCLLARVIPRPHAPPPPPQTCTPPARMTSRLPDCIHVPSVAGERRYVSWCHAPTPVGCTFKHMHHAMPPTTLSNGDSMARRARKYPAATRRRTISSKRARSSASDASMALEVGLLNLASM